MLRRREKAKKRPPLPGEVDASEGPWVIVTLRTTARSGGAFSGDGNQVARARAQIFTYICIY